MDERDIDRELDEMEDRSERLGKEIDETREDWERKKSEESIPSAPQGEGDDEPPPEQQYPAKGD
jgi:hypothetical protein